MGYPSIDDMEDNIPLKRRKSKYDRLESRDKKVLVWIRQIEAFSPEGKAKLSPSYGPHMLEIHSPLDTLFRRWESHNETDVPFSSWYYAKYPFNHPTPYPPPRTGENEPQQLNAEDTPYSMKIKDGTIIFARTLIILPRPIIEHHSSSSYYQRHAFVQVYTDGSDDSSGTSRSRWDDKPSVLTHLDQRRLLADGD